MKVGFLGGSFDPIHSAHIKLGQAARRQLGLDRVYFVLSPKAPLKKNPSQSPNQLKLSMLRLALKGHKGLIPVDWELKRRGPSYTITTLRWYRRIHPSHKLFFIMGSDSFSQFHRWKEPKRILEQATLVVGQRPKASLKNKQYPFVKLKGSFPDLSSTLVRRRLKNGRSVNTIIPANVRNYIRKMNLYV